MRRQPAKLAKDLCSCDPRFYQEERKKPHDLVAINVLLEPDAATAARARAINARLKANFPAGFALDEAHAPHVTLVQCFVREEDVTRVAEALRATLGGLGKVDWQSRAVALYALTHENLGLMGIVIAPTPDLVRVQAKVIETLQPFLVAKGTAEAFAPNADGSLVNQPTVDYVNGFIATRTGDELSSAPDGGDRQARFRRGAEGRALRSLPRQRRGGEPLPARQLRRGKEEAP